MNKTLLVAVLLLAASCVRAEGDGEVSVYSVFSYYTNTLYVAVELIDNTTAATAAECATACEKSKCTDWSWCPTDVTGLAGGCEVVPFGDAIKEAGMEAPGTCLTSYDPTEGRKAYLGMFGDKVRWTAGFRQTEANGTKDDESKSPSPSNPNKPVSSPEPEEVKPAGTCDKAVQADTLLRPDQAGYIVATKDGMDSATDCCELCTKTDACNVFLYCDSKADSCTSWTTKDGMSYTFPAGGSGGNCLLMSADDTKGIQSFSQGAGTPWSSGILA